MDCFQDIFTPPASPTHEYNPREDVLNQIRGMEDGERREVRAQQLMNQFQGEQQKEQGTVGGDPQGYPPVNPQGYQPVNHQGYAPVNPFTESCQSSEFSDCKRIQFLQFGKHHTTCSTKMETARQPFRQI